MNTRSALAFFVCLFLIIITSACFSSTPAPGFTPEDSSILLPEDVTITIDSDALEKDTEVDVQALGEGEPLGEGSNLVSASLEYQVNPGEEYQIGQNILTVPISTEGKTSLPVSSEREYLTWVEPVDGTPFIIGTIVRGDQAEIPVVGPGNYQVYSIRSHKALLDDVKKYIPLAVPSYQQRTPAWCSPTALTNLAQFHEGSWPSGGFGSLWGETSNYYLAAKEHQPAEEGRHFHLLLDAVGYAAPADVRESFSDGNVEVIIWNWQVLHKGTYEEFAHSLFDAYQAYVESYLWGVNSAPRPVAWGSGKMGHSRTITGSNGSVFYYNDPSSGSLNDIRSWQDYRQYIIDSLDDPDIEVIDTVVFHAPPRPESERKGVIWLYPTNDQGFPGSVAFVSGETDEYLTHWHWDGSKTLGYYYQDLTGRLVPSSRDKTYFKAAHIKDSVEVGFGVRNITDQTQDYEVGVALISSEHSIFQWFHESELKVGPAEKTNIIPAGRSQIAYLPHGGYWVMFVLKQSGVVQDVKWVRFNLFPSDLTLVHTQTSTIRKVHCRQGPDKQFESLQILEEGSDVLLLGVDQDQSWGNFLVADQEDTVECWIHLSGVNQEGVEDAPVIETPAFTPNKRDGQPKNEKVSCSNYGNQNQCLSDSRCTWKVGNDGSGYCTSKD